MSSKSSQSGALKGATTENRRGSLSSRGASTKKQENRTTSDTSDTTVQKNRSSQPIENSNSNVVKLIQALAAKLGELVVWKKLDLDGLEYYALCFPVSSWHVSTSGELAENE